MKWSWYRIGCKIDLQYSCLSDITMYTFKTVICCYHLYVAFVILFSENSICISIFFFQTYYVWRKVADFIYWGRFSTYSHLTWMYLSLRFRSPLVDWPINLSLFPWKSALLYRGFKNESDVSEITFPLSCSGHLR